jgi:hypothetical protein
MVWLNLFQNRSVMVKTAVSGSVWWCEGMVRLYLGQDVGMSIWS